MYIWIALATIIIVLLVIWLSGPSGKFDPKGKTIFISGCDTGIGRQLAIHFSRLGCGVFAGCLEPDRAGLPDSVCVVPLDITKEGSVNAAVEFVKKRLEEEQKSLWALVNNAGVCVCGFFEWQTWRQVELQVQVNLLGTLRLTRAFVPLLRRRKGRLITVSSVNGFISYPGLSVYSATKRALEGLHDSLRLELGLRHGIRVITVQPGDYARLTSIMSQHQRHAGDMWDGMSPEDRAANGEFFHKYQRLTAKHCGLTSPGSFEGADILRDMEEAVLSRNPADKYLSASMVLRMFYRLMSVCPTRVTDFVLGKAVQVMMSSDDKVE